MTATDRPLRADARRNRARILAAAGELFARRGHEAQMEEIAARCGLGMGTLYRHFPNKHALLTAMVGERFRGMADLARQAEEIDDPGAAFETLLRRYLEAAEGDAAYQLALMGSTEIDAAEIEEEKTAFTDALRRVIARAVAAGRVRADLVESDFPMLTSGIMATMYFGPGGAPDWRRHLELVLDGVRVPLDAPDRRG